MKLELSTNIIQTKPQFKARFSQKDVNLLMDSAKNEALFIQDIMVRSAHRIAAVCPEKANLTAKTMYGRLNVILDHVDSIMGKVLFISNEKFANGKKIFKIINENNEILGSANSPIAALENAFVMRGKFELAPVYWGHKLPDRIINERVQKLGEITEQDVISKVLN